MKKVALDLIKLCFVTPVVGETKCLLSISVISTISKIYVVKIITIN